MYTMFLVFAVLLVVLSPLLLDACCTLVERRREKRPSRQLALGKGKLLLGLGDSEIVGS